MTALVWPTTVMTIAKGGEFHNDRGAGHVPRFHEGCDVAIGVGTSIYASGNGTVDLVANTGTKTGYGLYVRVRYGNVEIINSHMSRVDVKVGDPVSVGTKLGLSGGTKGAYGAGDASGPHDHLEIRVAGVLVNPVGYLVSRSQTAGTGTATPLPPAPPAPTKTVKENDMLVYANQKTNVWVYTDSTGAHLVPEGQGDDYVKISGQPLISLSDTAFNSMLTLANARRTGRAVNVVANIETNAWLVIGPDIDIPVGTGETFWEQLYGPHVALHNADIVKLRAGFRK